MRWTFRLTSKALLHPLRSLAAERAPRSAHLEVALGDGGGRHGQDTVCSHSAAAAAYPGTSSLKLHELNGTARWQALRAEWEVQLADMSNRILRSVLGSWVGARRLFHRSVFLTAFRMALPPRP